MINKVWLRQWKAYDSVELDFGEGTTFLIAENGVGKSSIVQGLYFALFGSLLMLGTDRPISNVVRGDDGTIAVAGCEVSLGSNVVRLERAVERTSRSPGVQTTIQIDGQLASENDWLELLHAETGVDAAQLALLAFVHEGSTISVDDAGLSIVEMLAEVFGVGRLRRAALQCDLSAKRLDRDNDSLRKSLRDIPSKRNAQHIAELQDQLLQMTAQADFLRNRISVTGHYEMTRQRWENYAASMLSFNDAKNADREHVARLIRQIRNLISNSYAEDDLPDNRLGLGRAIALLSERHENLIADQARLEQKRETSLHNIEIVESGEATCPTCRQPLSSQAADRALLDHREVIQNAEAELYAIDRDLNLLRQLTGDARELASMPEPRPPDQPNENLPETGTDTSRDMSSLQSEVSQLTEAIQHTKIELAAMQRVDEERSQNELLSARLFDGYRTAERARLAAATMTMLANVICADRIAPMKDELQKRWPTLCSGSQLHMDATGALSLEIGGYVVPYSNLSGGQRTLAQLTIRLLALQMATRCPFFILDEPLEHLDSRNRRSLANLLVHATHESSQLQQVLVTTYEESVTRRLSSVSTETSVQRDVNGSPVAHVVRIAASRKG